MLTEPMSPSEPDRRARVVLRRGSIVETMRCARGGGAVTASRRFIRGGTKCLLRARWSDWSRSSPRPAASIWGTDINHDYLAQAERGRFGRWSLRGLPRRFAGYLPPTPAQDDGRLEVAPAIRAMVRFERHNLMHPPPLPPDGDGWDFILCRNVL